MTTLWGKDSSQFWGHVCNSWLQNSPNLSISDVSDICNNILKDTIEYMVVLPLYPKGLGYRGCARVIRDSHTGHEIRNAIKLGRHLSDKHYKCVNKIGTISDLYQMWTSAVLKLTGKLDDERDSMRFFCRTEDSVAILDHQVTLEYQYFCVASFQEMWTKTETINY